jgi:predicted tellurium resistance membrane protein TerC
MLDLIVSPEAWLALVTLTALEIVLGVDNIIFISILVGRLPKQQRDKARVIGLGLAMGTRILFLLMLVWLIHLSTTLFSVLDQDISGRDLILIIGGLFLLAKAVMEIHKALEGAEEEHRPGAAKMAKAGFFMVLAQIAVIDIVFSLDSVITAIGMAQDVEIMIAAVIIAVLVMMVSARAIGDFVDRHPTIRMLALSFLILIGVALMGEGLEMHIPKGYIYFAMAFAVGVEMLNLRLRRPGKPVHLHTQIRPPK